MDRPEAQSVAGLVAVRAEQDPTRSALVFPDDHADMTRADVHLRAGAAAVVFSSGGLAHGKKLAVMLPNGARYATSLFGAWRLGAIVVPVDPMLKGPDARDLIMASCATALVIDERRLVELSGLLEECNSLEAVFAIGGSPSLPRFRDFDALLSATVEKKESVAGGNPEAGDVAIEAYRFHTDNLEAVRRTHEALIEDAARLADQLAMTPEDRGICAIPLGHGDGVTALVAAVAAGSRLVIPERFDARHFWELAAAQRATWLALMPTQFLDLQFAGPPESSAHVSVRVVTIAGRTVTSKARDEFADKFGVRVVAQVTA
ncbi:MAG TPA: class I adenylate-forming enzyme family protein [Candidatus Eremiobacteraceae bacterium]